MDIEQEIKEHASHLGFDLCGISPAEPSPFRGYVLDWLGEGKHGDMDWLARDPERRLDPSLVLPEARSAIVVGLNYYQEAPPARGKIATYALGADYHDGMTRKLREFSSWLDGKAGGISRAYVDTGPVLERETAARAGVAWQGKSTMAVHPRLGTWFFIGAILTTVDLKPDKPMADHCGSCTRCMDACPTGAITGPYQLDARKCISYLTIENKGPIPEEFREKIGDRLYGCDDCLLACPWNRWAKQSSELSFAPYPRIELREMLAWTDEAFRIHFKGSPVKRIKLPRWKRNICVVLGNIGDGGDVEALEAVARDGDPLVQEHALWALGKIRERCKL